MGRDHVGSKVVSNGLNEASSLISISTSACRRCYFRVDAKWMVEKRDSAVE